MMWRSRLAERRRSKKRPRSRRAGSVTNRRSEPASPDLERQSEPPTSLRPQSAPSSKTISKSATWFGAAWARVRKWNRMGPPSVPLSGSSHPGRARPDGLLAVFEALVAADHEAQSLAHDVRPGGGGAQEAAVLVQSREHALRQADCERSHLGLDLRSDHRV